jgi:hypothetical protein
VVKMAITLTEQELRELDPNWRLLNLHYTDSRYQHAKQQVINQRTGLMMGETGPARERWLFEHGKIEW